MEFTVRSTRPGNAVVDTLKFIDTLRSLRVPQMVGARIYYDAPRQSIAVSVPQSSDVDADTLVELALVQLGPLRICVIAEEDDPGYEAALRDAKARAAGTEIAEGSEPSQGRRLRLCFYRPKPEFKSLAAGEFAELLDHIRRDEEFGQAEWVYSGEAYSPDRGATGGAYPYFELTGHVKEIEVLRYPADVILRPMLDDATAEPLTAYLNGLIGRRVALVLGSIIVNEGTMRKKFARPIKSLNVIDVESVTQWGPMTLLDALNNCSSTAIRGAADISVRRRMDRNWDPIR